jgi:dTDP-4-dehydrorhamnose reductase
MPEKITILVTGANGQLGQELMEEGPARSIDYDFIFLSKEDLSIDDAEKVEAYFNEYKPAYLINCAAYTAVDKAESEKELAFRINSEAVGILAAACNRHNTKFIHISTDYVFDGTATTPYKEDDPVNPQSVYGASKLAGEKLAMSNNPDTVIIRTSWLYSKYGKNFVKTMLRLLKEKEEISVVNDQLGSPTHAADLAAFILLLVASKKWHPGIYHFSNDGAISWYDFANAIKEIISSHCTIQPIPTSGYPTPAKRPAYSVLDKRKVRDFFDMNIRNWQDSLEDCLEEIAGFPDI